MEKQCYAWDEANFTWDGNDYTWDDVCFALILLAGHEDYNTWGPEKQKQFLTLYAKVRMQTEPETFYTIRPLNEILKVDQEKKVVITAEQVKLVIEQVLKITCEN